MRYHALYHLTGIALVFVYFLFCLSSVVRTALKDISPYALVKEELVALDPELKKNATVLIPKIIHQVYLGWDDKEIPAQWQEAQRSCIELHPDYEYMLWTNESARELLMRVYPWFLHTYDHYWYPIQRADSIRYFILANHGGIYIDLDNGCHHNFDPLLTFPAWMPATKIHIGLTNHIMGTRRDHPYFTLLISRLQAYNYNWLLPYMTIMNSAGPHFVSMVWEEYLRTRPSSGDEVRILMQEEYAGKEWSFFTKKQGGSWNRWDTAAFQWVGRHVLLFSIACFLSICAVTSCIWWITWKVAMRSQSKEMTRLQKPRLLLWQKSD